MEDDIDIYADLPTFETKYSENLDSKNEQDILREQLELKKQITELTTKLDNFQKINENLETNLFSLLKTAKAEIARKDKMINELRKELDDVLFKRGMYLKTNNSGSRKSGCRKMLINMQRKSDNSCPSVKKNDTEVMEADPICSQVGEQQTKSTLIPATLFSERLLKGMPDKHHMEVKEMHVNGHINSENCNQNIENYVFESDKENGTIGGNNFCNTREAPDGTRTLSSVNEYFNNMAKLKDTVKDFQLNSETEVHSGLQQNLIFGMKNSTGKRANEVADTQVSRKRIKSVGGEQPSELRRNDACNTVVISNKASKYRNFNSSTNSFEMSSRFIKDSEHSHNASAELKNHEYFIRDAKKREDRCWEDKGDVFREKRDTIERAFKRHGTAVQESMLALGERNMDNRCIEDSKKDNYRVIQGENRKVKQKEHQRFENHRLRVKAVSCAKYREEQYSRRHSNYGSRFEKRYNFRDTDADKSKFLKDASDVRGMTKCSTTDETSTGQKTSDAKTYAKNTKFESRKLKSESGSSCKRQRKKNEYNENGHRQTSVGKSIESVSKYSELQEQSAQWNDYAMIPRNQCVVTKTEHTVLEELQKHVKKRLQNTLSEKADSEILNTSNRQKESKSEESTYETRCDFKKFDSPSKVDNILIAKPEHSITTVEQMKESKLLLGAISQPESTPTSCNSSPQDQINSESIESVENVENIERFIRDCTSMNEKASPKISTTLDVIHALENSSANVPQRVGDTVALLVVCNSEDITDEYCQSISDFNGIARSAKRDHQGDQMRNKLTCNDSTLYTSNTSVSDGEQIEMQVEQPISSKYIKGNLSPNEQEAFNSVEGESNQAKQMKENSPEKHSVFCKDTNEERTGYNYMDNVGEKNNMGENLNSKCNRDKNNPNDYTSIATVKSEQENMSIVMDVVPKQGLDKQLEEMKMLSDDYGGASHVQNSNKAVRDSSKNIQGKIVVFAHRKKPVCLANSNANMTILINKESNTYVNLSVLKTIDDRV